MGECSPPPPYHMSRVTFHVSFFLYIFFFGGGGTKWLGLLLMEPTPSSLDYLNKFFQRHSGNIVIYVQKCIDVLGMWLSPCFTKIQTNKSSPP